MLSSLLRAVVSVVIALFFAFLLALAYHTYRLHRDKRGLIPSTHYNSNHRIQNVKSRRQPYRVGTRKLQKKHSRSRSQAIEESEPRPSLSDEGEIVQARRVEVSYASASLSGTPSPAPDAATNQVMETAPRPIGRPAEPELPLDRTLVTPKKV